MTSPSIPRRRVTVVLRDAAIVSALSAVLALGFNALRSESLPLVALEEYRILVPCPVALAKIESMSPGDPRLADEANLVIDARDESEFSAWHLPGARNLVNDFITDVPAETVDALVEEILENRTPRLVVYGDGGRPDSGEDLGKLLAGKGLKNVFFIEGGAPALQPQADAGEEAAP